MRRNLSNRRACKTFPLRWYGVTFSVSIGLFDDGTVAECFVTGSKSGSDVQSLARDGAILFSMARQFNTPIETIQKALTRNPDGSPQSFLGALVDAIVFETSETP